MSNIQYQQFYMSYGIRNRTTLSNPRAFNIENFALPKNSIVHYLPTNATDLGPDETFFALQRERIRPYADNVTEMTSFIGSPRRKGAFNVSNLKRTWIQKRRGFRRVTDINRALDDRNTAILANYSLIPMQWRYLPLPMARFWRFQNLLSTLYTQAKYYAEHSDRHQFILVNVPDEMPTKMQLNISVEDGGVPLLNAYQNQHRNKSLVQTYSDVFDLHFPGISSEFPGDVARESFDESALGFETDSSFIEHSGLALEEMNRIRLGYFQNDDSLFIQDLWQWLSEKREESLLNIIPSDHYDKINFVFLRMGKFTVLNLGRLSRWTKSKENPKGDAYAQVSRLMLQHLTALKLLTGVQEQATIEETIPDENTGESEILEVSETVEDDVVIETVVAEDETPTGIPKKTVTVKEIRDKINAGQPGIRTQIVDAFKSLTEEIETTEAPRALRLVSAPDVDAETVIEPPLEDKVEDPLISGIRIQAESLLSKGLITQGEYKRHLRLAESYKTIPSPFNEEISLEEYRQIPKEIVWDFKPKEVVDIAHVKDKSMLKSTLIDYDRKYVEEVMQKDVINLVLGFQKAGYAITDFKVERQVDALNDLYDYTVKISPVKGAPSTVRFQLPVVDKNGKYKVGGIKYFMRKLRFDKPIRKISPSTVALSTYYGKLFVDRSDKRRHDYGEWLKDAMNVAALSNPPLMTEIVYGNSFTDSQPVPRTYSAIAKEVISFDAAGMNFFFDYPNIGKNFPDWNGQGNIPVGKRGRSTVTMDREGYLQVGPERLGHISKLFGADPVNRPNELVTISILGQEFPLAIVLMYLEGFTQFVDKMEIKPQRRTKGARVQPDQNTFEIVFADEIWRIPRITHPDVLIYSSLQLWKNALKNYSVAELDNQDNYNALLSDMQLSGRYLYEFSNLKALFIDPIAEENLEAMNEPTEFIPLLKKAAFYLATDEYPSDLSSQGSLFKGYERMAGAVYRTFAEAVRRQSSSNLSSRAQLDFPPFEILSAIQKDPSVSLVEDSNPIQNLKEKENLTYSGTGGRGKRSMTRRTRAFHPSDIGIRSESSVDNGDVGINCYLSANPNLTSLRGTARTETDLSKEKGFSNVLSTSALVSPFSTYDDPKRVNFIGIQSSHKRYSVGDDLGYIRTGYELMMAQRTDDLFSSVAKGPGTITEKTKGYVVIKYDDPELGEDRIELGRKFGIVTGHTEPHEVVCDLEVGAKVDKDHVVAYHPGFFARDWREPTQVAFKNGVTTNIALVENNNTFEDASLISERLSQKMTTLVTHTRVLMVNFNQAIRNLVSEGQHVDNEDTLAFIEDEVSATFDYFDESTMETLKRLGNPAPRAKHVGKVEKIEVFYFGEKEDMSDSVRKIADKYDSIRAKNAKLLGTETALTGQVFTPSRIDGMPLEIDMMAIRIYITHQRGMGDGDKLVVGNQKKSVVSGVYKGICRTTTPVLPGGQPWDIDLQFSYRAINARIVNSALLLGMGNILIENIQQEMLKAYDSE
ncbi:RNA polymerase beta subunit [Klebsiella phage vB_KpM_Centimanus]